MLVAIGILAVVVSFFKKNNTWSFLLKALIFVALIGLGFVVASYKNNFSTYVLLVVSSAAPMLLSTFDLKQHLIIKNEKQSNSSNNQVTKGSKKHSRFVESNGTLLSSIGIFGAAVCISIATLYVGLETYLGAGIGLAFGLALTFLTLAIDKNRNAINGLAYFFSFTAAGLFAGDIVLTLLYSFSLTNILFSAAALLCGIFAIANAKSNKNIWGILYYLGTICFFLTIFL
jgi:hypothetical protein